MATLAQTLPETTMRVEPRPAPRPRVVSGAAPVLLPWLRAQSINVTRHAAALRPFKRDEFGPGAAAPSEGHLQVVNDLITKLRRGLLKMSKNVHDSIAVASEEPRSHRLQRVVSHKDAAHRWVQGIEKIWDFYFELFGQRQGRYGDWLLSCDRIAMDCYQAAYTNLGTARSVPAPPPFCYMKTGFAPATIRRGIPLRRLGKQLNPFPLVQLPYHRLVNPWTLGAVMDVIGRAPAAVLGFSQRGPHPTPYLRLLISTELLRRMGFEMEAEQYARAWTRIYPNPRAGTIPTKVLETFPKACALAVDTMCYRPFQSLGNKTLAQVLHFGKKDQKMIEEAAQRLAAGVDPGIVPERYLIGAARYALDKRLARPGVIAENFYKELVRR